MSFPSDSNKQLLLWVKLCVIAEQFFVGFYSDRPSLLAQHYSSSFPGRF